MCIAIISCFWVDSNASCHLPDLKTKNTRLEWVTTGNKLFKTESINSHLCYIVTLTEFQIELCEVWSYKPFKN